MNRKATILVLIVLAALFPTWFVALQGEPPAEEIEIDPAVSDIRPLGEVFDMPEKLSPSQVGVIVWLALFALLAVMIAAHRFMNEAVRPPDDEAIRGDGGADWLTTDDRTILEYHPAGETREGIVVMGALTVLSIAFAALFTGEYLSLARTQYFGIYAAGLFLSLAALTIAYYAWFMPHIEVAEQRGHGDG